MLRFGYTLDESVNLPREEPPSRIAQAELSYSVWAMVYCNGSAVDTN